MSTAQGYDLSTPAPLSRETAKRLAVLQDTLAEEMRVHLRRLLRLRLEVSVVAPDVARLRHFASFLNGRAWWYAGGSKADPAGRSVLCGCAPGLISLLSQTRYASRWDQTRLPCSMVIPFSLFPGVPDSARTVAP